MTQPHNKPEQIININLSLIARDDESNVVKPLIEMNYPDLIMKAADLSTIVQLMSELIDPLELHFTREAGTFDQEVHEIFTSLNDLGLIRAAQLRFLRM